MNLTTHIFLEQPRVGRTVLNPLSSDLISLQEVRQALIWSLEADDASANAMSIHFQGATHATNDHGPQHPGMRHFQTLRVQFVQQNV